MPTDQNLTIVVKLQDEASKGLQGLSTQVNAMGQKVGSAMSSFSSKMGSIGSGLTNLGNSMSAVGTKMSVGLTLPIVAAGTAVSKLAMDYQSASEMLTTNAGYAQSATDKLSKSVLDFAASGQSQFTAQDMMANGLYHIASLGVPAANAMAVLKVATQGAAVGQARLEDVSNALGAAVASNIKGSQNYTDAMATLVGITGSGNMHMQDLATSLGNVLPAGATVGLSLKDLGAAMATMTDNGMVATEASTNLRHTIMMMAAPSKNAQKALASVGLTQYQLAEDMRSKGLLFALQDLKKHMEAAGETADQQTATISAAFGGARTGNAIMLLLNNLDRVSQKYGIINDGIAQYQQKVIAQGQTAQASFAEMKASIDASAMEIGNAILPLEAHIFPQLASVIRDVAKWFTNLSPGMQSFIVKSAAVLAIIGPILAILGPIVTTLGFMFTAVSKVAGGLSWLATAFTGADGAASGLLATVAPFAVTFLAIAAAIVAVTNAVHGMQDSWSNAKDAADQSMGIINSKAWKDAYAKASPDEKAKMDKMAAGTKTNAQAAWSGASRYLSPGGGLNAIQDWVTGGVMGVGATKAAPAPTGGGYPGPLVAPAGTKTGGYTNVFNFNGTVAGDAGIKDIINQTVSTLNRQTQLRTYAGARS